MFSKLTKKQLKAIKTLPHFEMDQSAFDTILSNIRNQSGTKAIKRRHLWNRYVTNFFAAATALLIFGGSIFWIESHGIIASHKLTTATSNKTNTMSNESKVEKSQKDDAYITIKSQSTSMYPTIPNQGTVRVLTNNFTPYSGEVIAFEYPDNPSKIFIKRIIGMPGEVVSIHNGHVFIDGKQLQENYLTTPTLGVYGPHLIKKGSYFVLGDNRQVSEDSRNWKTPDVPLSLIIGRVTATTAPDGKTQVIH